MKVCVDPGHGGIDGGACSVSGVREADINLQVAVKVGAMLKRAGWEVVFTRTEDVKVSLGARAKACNAGKADCFVSIHCNAASNPKALGTEVFRLGSGKAHALAVSIYGYLIAFVSTAGRGIKSPPPSKKYEGKLEHWPVLHDTWCPAVLVELLFVTNESDLARLLDVTCQNLLAAAIVAGVMGFKSK